jgi:hypothetical protein
MSSSIPTEWQYDPPRSFVVGDRPYASALASVLGTVALPFEQLEMGPTPSNSGGYPRIFQCLKWVFLVVPEAMPAGEALRHHHEVWEWVEKLSPDREQHDLAFVFILPPGASQSYEGTLAAGLIVREIDPATSGHAVWRRSGSLSDLLALVGRTRPMDVVRLRRRLASDSRQIALAKLRTAATEHDLKQGKEAALGVLAAFRGQEHHLDLFCQSPCHKNGHLLREWLKTAVTSIVTPAIWEEQRGKISDWLASAHREAK